MRPIAPLGLLLLLSACSSAGNLVGSPIDGAGGFVSDTVSFRANPNRPAPDSDNARRVMGQDVATDPVLPEPGNIWPSMSSSEPTLADLRTEPTTAPTAPSVPATPPQRPMSSPMVPAPLVPAPLPAVPAVPASPSATIPPAGTIASGTVLQTGKGSAVINTGNSGIMTYTLPSGSTGRAINNGNGTMTLIGTDGSVMSVPAPR